jgi:hypothetical protein
VRDGHGDIENNDCLHDRLDLWRIASRSLHFGLPESCMHYAQIRVNDHAYMDHLAPRAFKIL